LNARKLKADNKAVELKAKIDALDKRNVERREVEAKRREEEVKFLHY
jgi:hypothetical protein